MRVSRKRTDNNISRGLFIFLQQMQEVKLKSHRKKNLFCVFHLGKPQKKFFLNGRAIKALPPSPTSGLMDIHFYFFLFFKSPETDFDNLFFMAHKEKNFFCGFPYLIAILSSFTICIPENVQL